MISSKINMDTACYAYNVSTLDEELSDDKKAAITTKGRTATGDTLELTSKEAQKALPSDNYDDYYQNYLKNCKLRDRVDEMLSGYFFDNNRNVNDLKDFFKETCLSQGLNKLQNTYDLFLNRCVGNAGETNFVEGKKVAGAYNPVGDCDYIYYNSDYYYALEDSKSALAEVAAQLSKEYNVPAVNLKGTESARELTNGPNYNFNEIWNWNSRDIVNRSSMINTSMVPPKGFTFFYKENKYEVLDRSNMDSLEAQKGILEIAYGGQKYKTDVSFNNSLVLGDIKMFHNAGDLISFGTSREDKEVNNFISNINIYTRLYSYSYLRI